MAKRTKQPPDDRYDLREGLLRSVDVVMKQQGLSIERVGELMGSSRSTAYRYLRAREVPALDHFSNLFRYLREDPEEFLRRGRRGEPNAGLVARSLGAERLSDLLNADEMTRVVEAIDRAKRSGLLELFFLLAEACERYGVAAESARPRRR